MWNFSFDDIARRAQEEAAKLAEQAQDAAANMQSPGLFNLDSMNPEIMAAPSPTAPPTSAAPSSAKIGSSSLFGTPFSSSDANVSNTAPPACNASLDAGNADHVASLVSNVASPRASVTQGRTVNDGSSELKKKTTVTKLSTVSTGDDFFDSWGDNEGAASSSSPNTAIGAKSIEHENVVNVKCADHDVSSSVQKEEVDEAENQHPIDNESEHAEPSDENAWEDDIDIPDDTVEPIGESQHSLTEEVPSKEVEAETNAWDDDFDVPDATDAEDNDHNEHEEDTGATEKEVGQEENAVKEEADQDKNAWDDDFDIPIENDSKYNDESQPVTEGSANEHQIDQETSSNGNECVVSHDKAPPDYSHHECSQEVLDSIKHVQPATAAENSLEVTTLDVVAEGPHVENEVDTTYQFESPHKEEVDTKIQLKVAVQSNERAENSASDIENDAQVEDAWGEDSFDIADGDASEHVHLSHECLGDQLTNQATEIERPCADKDADIVESHPSLILDAENEANTDANNDISSTPENDLKGENNVSSDVESAARNVTDPRAEDDLSTTEFKSDKAKDIASNQLSQLSEGSSAADPHHNVTSDENKGALSGPFAKENHDTSEENQSSEANKTQHNDSLGVDYCTKRDADCDQTESNQTVLYQAQEDSQLSSSLSCIEHDVATKSTIFDGAPDISAATQSLQTLFDTSKSSSMFGWSFQSADGGTGGAAKDANINVTNSEAIVETVTESIGTSSPPDVVSDMNDLYNDGALDDMYDDDSEEEDSDVEASAPNEAEHIVDKPIVDEETNGEVNESVTDTAPEAMPQHVVDKFVKQLERMTESHQLEMDELHRSYRLEIAQVQAQLDEERAEKKKAKAREAVAAQDKHLSQMRDLEKTFNNTLKEKEEELEQVMKRNEGFTLKMDSMKREVDGLLKLVDERDDEIARLKQGHGNTMLKVEGSIKDRQAELSRKDAEIRDLKSSMSSLQAEFDNTKENYNTLKSRAKAVATELKDRRIEVRTLSSQNEELTTTNASLETELANLTSQNDQQRRTISYKDKDIESLNEKIKSLNKEMDAKDSLLQDRSSVGEKAISSYKRKAQEALAAANSRLAAANQAREEAESDAKAAKAASDDAVERARVAEAKRTDADRSASEAVAALEKEKSAHLQAISDWQHTVDEMKDSIESMRTELADAESSKDSLYAKMEQTKTCLNEQKELNDELRQKLIEAKDLCNSLQEEVHSLREDAQRSSAAAFKRQKDENLNPDGENDEAKTGMMNQAESDGTIIMLQQELQGANDAISELKLALRMALLEKSESSTAEVRHNTTYHHKDSTPGNDSTPLFFAIEKQNELNTARDEINRLANMLGDAESEKQEAFDAMEEMKRKMDEANARLHRYEKLGTNSNVSKRNPTSSSGYASYRGTGSNGVSRENDSAVNLEYLKNVMLSYLNAKTLAERRKLVPVVATVLCLTPEEHQKAVQSVEESAGLTGVASSFWENLESKAHNLM